MNRVMLDRLIVIALAALVPCIAVVAWAALTLRPGLPSGAQAALQGYRAYVAAHGDDDLAVQATVQAWYPAAFSAAMSARSYGDGWYFGTDYSYNAVAVTGQSALTATTGLECCSGSRPLPYPPLEAWCVALAPAGGQAARLIVVARHEDTYVAQWVIHELAEEPGEPGFAAALARIGCAAP